MQYILSIFSPIKAYFEAQQVEYPTEIDNSRELTRNDVEKAITKAAFCVGKVYLGKFGKK